VETGKTEYTHLDGTITEENILDVLVEPGSGTDVNTLSYTWEIVRWEGREMDI
jgi:hypothetical protein